MADDILVPVNTSELTPMQKAERLVKLAELKKRVTEEYDRIRAELLETTQQLDVYTLKTGSYTISRAKLLKPIVTDFEEAKESFEEKNIPYTTKVVFGDQMQTVFKELAKNGTEIPGVEVHLTEYVTVRVAKPKEDK